MFYLSAILNKIETSSMPVEFKEMFYLSAILNKIETLKEMRALDIKVLFICHS